MAERMAAWCGSPRGAGSPSEDPAQAGVAPNTLVRGNHIRNHKWGLHLDGTAIIGLQDLKGNLWHNQPAAGGEGALIQQEDAESYPFLYNPAIINGGSTMPPSWSPDGWFSFLFGQNYDCANDEGEDYCSQFVKRNQEKLTELDVRVANDSLENDPYTDETKWILKDRLYNKLDEDPELQDSLVVLADLYDQLQGSTTALFKFVDDWQRVLYEMDSILTGQLEVNAEQIDSLAILIQEGLVQLSDSALTSAQRQVILASINDYRQAIGDLTIWNSATMRSAAEDKAATANDVQTANAAVNASELIETNRKQVNDIYLVTIGKDVEMFTGGQIAALFAIANQCPMIGGNAVFQARSLYGLIDDAQQYDDSALCALHGIEVKSLEEEHVSAAKMVPNPASDEATLVLTRAMKDPGTLFLYDAVGAEVLRRSIPADAMRFVFATAALAPALYHFKVLSAGVVIGVGRLTIVR